MHVLFTNAKYIGFDCIQWDVRSIVNQDVVSKAIDNYEPDQPKTGTFTDLHKNHHENYDQILPSIF